MAQRKYETDEERRAAIAMQMRARWRNPKVRVALKAALKKAAETRQKQDQLSAADLAQFLREYVERDPTGSRDWRYTLEQLGRRYLISATYVPHLASRHGIKRRKRMKKIGPAKMKEIARMFLVEGKRPATIAALFDVSAPAIIYRLKTNGITSDMRGSGGEVLRDAA